MRPAPATRRPVGVVTRGTTATGRLRRVDRWLLATRRDLLRTQDLLVVDLGFGARPITTLELAARIRRVNDGARVVGLEIDPGRVAEAAPLTSAGVSFAVGGFELAGLRPHVVRAFNVLRQYGEGEVDGAWQRMTGGLQPGGVVVEGTCDESGRLGSWVALGAGGPSSLTLAVDLRGKPSDVATRLPKCLIHRNVPGEAVSALLAELDARWAAHAALSGFGPRQRFAATVGDLRRAGWPVLGGRGRWRRGEVTVRWDAVRPLPR
jgi:hypothetical protein